MKIGVNTTLFAPFDLETAFRHTALCGYEGIELSAIDWLTRHLVVEQWREINPRIRQWASRYGLQLLAIEQTSHQPEVMELTCAAAADLGIAIVNTGPGGKADDESTFGPMVDRLGRLVDIAAKHGVTLCVKAHVGDYVHDTPSSLKLLRAIPSRHLALDLDPSHLHRVGEEPSACISQVIDRLGHVHIRDCKGRQISPGPPATQANGRGDINLVGLMAELHRHGYTGPVNLEVCGAKETSLLECVAIAAEARGHMRAALQAAESQP